jgi:DNA-binding NarL/FixJ family response regulator
MLVDDHEVVRIGLRTLLSHHPDFEIVAEAGTADEAIVLSTHAGPDVVLMDVRLPGRSGIEACAEIVRRCSQCRVIMLTSFADDALLFEAIAAGAAGYVLKQVGSDNLIKSIEAVGRGESLLDPSLTTRVFDRVRQSVARERQDAFAQLTEHELKILALLTEGKSNKEIGRMIGLGEKTVRNYVSNILAKLSLASRAEAAAYAVRHRIEDLLGR